MTFYLADTSAWAQRVNHASVIDGFLDLSAKGNLACCDVVRLELGYSVRNHANLLALGAELGALRWLPVDERTMARAVQIQESLTGIGAHRLPPMDLIVAACADLNGATVLHHDTDFATIARVTDQAVLDVFDLWPRPAE